MFKPAKPFRAGTGLQRSEEEAAAARYVKRAAPLPPPPSTALVAAAAPTERETEREVVNWKDGGGETMSPLRRYPSVAFYSPVRSLAVHVDVRATARGGGRWDAEGVGADVVGRRVEAALRRGLSGHGCTYVLSNCHCDHRRGRPVAGDAVLYCDYITALVSLFRDFCRLRDAAPGGCSHHTAQVRVSGHSRWRDVSALLAVEGGRLVLFISAASRAAQQYLQQRMGELSGQLQWVAGATLVTEPAELGPTALNPLLAAWSVFLSLPLAAGGWGLQSPHPPNNSSSSNSALAAAPAAAAAAAAEEALSVGAPQQPLEGFALSVLSSVPFSGARQFTPAVRLEAVDPIYPTLPPPQQSQGRGEGQTQQNNPQQPSAGGRRLVWRVGFAGEGAARPLLTPSALTTTVACLVGLRGLRGFTVTVDGPPPEEEAPAAQQAAEEPAPGVRGLVYVGLSGGGGLVARRGPSSQSWGAFSRLSSAAWLTDDQRRRSGLVEVDEDGEEVPLECEMDLLQIQCRRPHQPTGKRPRDDDDDDEEGEGDCRASGSDARRRAAVIAFEEALRHREPLPLDVEGWGPHFLLLSSVTRIVDAADDDEAVEDIGDMDE